VEGVEQLKSSRHTKIHHCPLTWHLIVVDNWMKKEKTVHQNRWEFDTTHNLNYLVME
ncbi:hypothetical protein THOM_2658, partial [Trachipleistophora hominis]